MVGRATPVPGSRGQGDFLAWWGSPHRRGGAPGELGRGVEDMVGGEGHCGGEDAGPHGGGGWVSL